MGLTVGGAEDDEEGAIWGIDAGGIWGGGELEMEGERSGFDLDLER